MASFYEGYTKRTAENEQSGMRDLQQMGTLVQLHNSIKTQQEAGAQSQRDIALRNEIAAIPPEKRNATTVLPILQKYSKDPFKAAELDVKLQEGRETRTARAQQVSDTLDMRQQALNQQRDLALQRTQDANQQSAIMNSFREQQLALQRQQQEFQREIQRQGIELKRTQVETTQGQVMARNVQGLGTALERASLPEADAVLRGVEDALKKIPDLAAYISGPKSLLPDIAIPQAIREGRQAAQKLFNITLKNRSGAAVTIPEFERLKQEFATGAWKDPKQFKAGIEQARKIISDHYRSIAAGFGPEVLKAYNENLRSTGGTPLLESQGTEGAIVDFGSLK